MTARDPDDRVEKRLTEILEAEADTTQVRDAWDALSTRLLLDPLESSPDPVLARGTRRRRRLLGGLVVGLGVAAVIAVVVATGGRASGANPVPVTPPAQPRNTTWLEQTSAPKIEYRATVSGHGVTGAVDVTFTVVA